MATITTFPTLDIRNIQYGDDDVWESPAILVADTYEPAGWVHRNKHWEAGVIFCDSAKVQAAATGSVAVVVKPWATMFYEDPTDTPLVDAAAPELITWQCRTYGARFTPAGMGGAATHYYVRFVVAGS